MEPYKSHYPNANLLLPVTERVTSRVVVLPTGTSVGAADIERIGRIIRDALTKSLYETLRLPRNIEIGKSFVEIEY